VHRSGLLQYEPAVSSQPEMRHPCVSVRL
jgi:hypothetical protein